MIESVKKKLGYYAADLIHQHTTVGIGTGSTVFFFIERLAKRCQDGLNIQAVASSTQSYELAKKSRIPLVSIDEVVQIDLTVDGADEIDAKKRMIKGGGGALLREKILARSSREVLILVEEKKIVSHLGLKKLPVEILPFGHTFTIKQMSQLGYHGTLRLNKEGTVCITDNQNYIYDIHFEMPRTSPEQDHDLLIEIPGVMETGFFFNLAGRVLIGYEDEKIELWK